MEYTTPIMATISMNIAMNVQSLDGPDSASGCSGSCCYAQGSDW